MDHDFLNFTPPAEPLPKRDDCEAVAYQQLGKPARFVDWDVQMSPILCGGGLMDLSVAEGYTISNTLGFSGSFMPSGLDDDKCAHCDWACDQRAVWVHDLHAVGYTILWQGVEGLRGSNDRGWKIHGDSACIGVVRGLRMGLGRDIRMQQNAVISSSSKVPWRWVLGLISLFAYSQ